MIVTRKHDSGGTCLMTMMMMMVVMIILLFINSIDANTTSELMKTAELLDKTCDTCCQNLIKDAHGCTIFCSFLDHVKKHDLHLIQDLYELGGRNTKPLEWAMQDTVTWKFQTKTEDDHETAEFFMTSTRNWIKRI